jgi:hypothetical protein
LTAFVAFGREHYIKICNYMDGREEGGSMEKEGRTVGRKKEGGWEGRRKAGRKEGRKAENEKGRRRPGKRRKEKEEMSTKLHFHPAEAFVGILVEDPSAYCACCPRVASCRRAGMGAWVEGGNI